MEPLLATNIMLLGGTGALAMLYVRERGNTKLIRSFFGPEFIRSLRKRDGVLFLRFDSSGDSDFKFVPWSHKDESFYYIELRRGDGKEKVHYKVRKKDLFRLRNRLNLALVVEDKIAALSPEVAKSFSSLNPVEKSRMLNAYVKYHSLKTRKENILQALRFESNPDKVESLKAQLEEIEKEIAEIREKWSAIIQEVDLDSVILLPDEKEKRLVILRPVRLDEVAEYLDATRPDELIYTAKKMFVDWQQVALESLKKMIVPKNKSSTRRSSFLTTILLGLGGLLVFFLLIGMLGR